MPASTIGQNKRAISAIGFIRHSREARKHHTPTIAESYLPIIEEVVVQEVGRIRRACNRQVTKRGRAKTFLPYNAVTVKTHDHPDNKFSGVEWLGEMAAIRSCKIDHLADDVYHLYT